MDTVTELKPTSPDKPSPKGHKMEGLDYALMGGSVITFSHLFFYLICLGAAAPALPVLAGVFLVLATLNTAKLYRFLKKKKISINSINSDNIDKASKAGLALFAAGWLSYLLVLGITAVTACLGPIALGISLAIIGAAALIFAYYHKEYIPMMTQNAMF